MKNIIRRIGIFIIALALSTSIMEIMNIEKVYGAGTVSKVGSIFRLVDKYESMEETRDAAYRASSSGFTYTNATTLGKDNGGKGYCMFFQKIHTTCAGTVNVSTSFSRSGSTTCHLEVVPYVGAQPVNSPNYNSTSTSASDSFYVSSPADYWVVLCVHNRESTNTTISSVSFSLSFTPDHSYSSTWHKTSSADCYNAEKGYYSYKCSYCGDSYNGSSTTKGSALGHNWTTLYGNCGGGSYTYCTRNKNHTDATHDAIDRRKNHTYGPWTYEDNNGIQNGYRYQKCSNDIPEHTINYQYLMEANAGYGISSTSGGGWCATGSKVIIDATIKEGYTWSNWYGSFSTTIKKYTVTNSIDRAYSVTACATRNYYQLAVNPIRDGVKNNNGFGVGYTFSVDVTDPLNEGSNNSEYDVTNVTKYCKQIPYGCTYKVTITNNPTGYTGSTPANCTGTVGINGAEATPTWTSTTHVFDVDRRITINGVNHDYTGSAGTDKTPSGISYDSFKFNITRTDRYGTGLGTNSNLVDYNNDTEKYGTTYIIKASNTPKGYTWNGDYSGTITGNTYQLVQWTANEYNIYYEKGLTDDITHEEVTGATRNTNIQATGTNRPYTHVVYDSNITLATISPVLGRNYQLQFDSNKPSSVSNQKENNNAEPTETSQVNGNLTSQNLWQITGQDSDITSNLKPTMGSTLTRPNYTATDNGSVTATALWNNTTIKNFDTPTLTGWTFLGWYDNQAGNNSTLVNNSDYANSVNTNADKSANSNVKVYGDITDYLVKPATKKFDKTLYARWQRTITLTFNMNGGQYINSSAPIVMTGVYYNNSDGYGFKLDGTLTQKLLPDYETQISSFKINGVQKGIDAYGIFDANGENSKYTLIKDDGSTYRFLGWSTNPSATEPDSNLSAYSSSHDLEYRVYDDTTLYAIWEPILTANINVYRTLGNLTFSDGSTPKTSVSGIKSSDGLQQLQVIAKPGEQCGYTIALTGSDTVKSAIIFDTKITDIYNHQGTWTDNLNPSTEEDLVSNQNHGLDRNIQLSNRTATRKFYIPQYLGTDKSYTTSQGVKVYTADLLLQQDSYYYKGLGKKEEILVHITIYLTKDKTGTPTKPTPTPENPNPVDPDPIISVLDELRTKLKIRLK